MRTDTVIDALRPFAEGNFSDNDRNHARRVVYDFDMLPKEPEVTDAEDVVIVIGAKDGMVLFQSKGNDVVEPSFIVWSVEDALETIEAIQKAIWLARAQKNRKEQENG